MVEKFTPKKKEIKAKMLDRDKVRTPDVMKELGRMVYDSYSWSYISKKISDMTNTILGEKGAKNLWEEYKAKRTELLIGDKGLKADIVKTIIDTDDQLHRINTICNKVLDDLIEDGYSDKTMVLKTLQEIRAQIKLQIDVVSKLTQGFDEHKLSKQKYIKESLSNLKDLDKNHFIKILRKPGEVFDPNILEIIKLSPAQFLDLQKNKRILVPGGTVVELE